MFIKLIYLLIFISIIWFILDQTYYSPKAQIKRLWKKAHNFSKMIGDLESEYIPDYTWNPSKLRRNKIGKVINSLLDYNFDPEKDEEYIAENRYTDEYIENEEYKLKKINSLLIQEEDWEEIEKTLIKLRF